MLIDGIGHRNLLVEESGIFAITYQEIARSIQIGRFSPSLVSEEERPAKKRINWFHIKVSWRADGTMDGSGTSLDG